MRRGIPFPAAIALLIPAGVVLLLAPHARADDLKLKDGTKVTGTIVGFEDSSFKVKTSYGFALVQRDQVASIAVVDPAKTAAEKPSEPAAAKAPAKAEAVKLSAPAQPAPPATKPAASAGPPPALAPAPGVAKNAAPPVAAPPSPAPTAASIPAPAKPAAPEPIREEVSGNTYVNETHGFRMYKPPGWQVIAGARAMLPGAVAAMGTADQTTYLLIGQEQAGKSLDGDIDATERRLRDIMDNFRPLGQKSITVSGATAIEHRFRGSVDQHDWSGTVVFIPRGARLYTIFGMTYADTDLVQIQENVIARAISSLQFTEQ